MSANGDSRVKKFENLKQSLGSKHLYLDDFIELVGVGEGLTPAVDDFFTGLLLSDRFTKNNYIKVSEKFFDIASNKTTRQSVLQLRFAEQGLLSLKFEYFIKTFITKSITSTEVIRLLSYGNTSGSDILAGILFYFKHSR